MRRAAAALALAVLVGLASLATLDSSVAGRFSQATAARAPSRRGDAPRRMRPVETEDEQEAEEEPATEETVDEEPAGDAVVVEPEPQAPQRVIRIVDGDGVPIPGVSIGWSLGCWEQTDGRGEMSYDAAATKETPHFFDGAAQRDVSPGEDRTEVVVSGLPRLDVSMVDARTGVPIGPVRLTLRRGFQDSGTEGWSSTTRWPLGVGEWGHAAFEVWVDPPPGRGGYRCLAWDGRVSQRAPTLRFAVPLFDTTSRTLEVRMPDGSPAVGAVVAGAVVQHSGSTGWWDSSRDVTLRAQPSGADGRIRIEDLPRIPFAHLAIHVAGSKRAGSRRPALAAVVGDIDPCTAPPAEPLVVILGPGVGHPGPSCAPGPPDGLEPYDGPTARLSVRALYRDGTPARHVTVDTGRACGWTDADGRAEFVGVPVGPRELLAVAHGFSRSVVRVDVRGDTSVEIREEEPRLVRLTVRDRDGEPVPSASVAAACEAIVTYGDSRERTEFTIAQLDGDVEDLAPLTDRLGVAVLRVPRGEVRYRVTLGDAVDYTTSARDEVEIRLIDPYR